MMRPARPRRELPHVAALFVVVLFVGFFPVASGRRTFSPNGLFADQAGIRGGDYPYGRPSRPVVGDAAATAYLFEPWAKTVHDAYAAGAIPLWDPHPALGAPLAASMQSAPFGPFYLPLFVHPSQRVWAFVIL